MKGEKEAVIVEIFFSPLVSLLLAILAVVVLSLLGALGAWLT
mgnify:CR=1 FL=1